MNSFIRNTLLTTGIIGLSLVTIQVLEPSDAQPVAELSPVSRPIMPLASATPEPPTTPPPLPAQTQLTGGTQVFQTFNNCGPAALSMALSYLEISKTQAELGQQLRPYQIPNGDNDDKSVTLIELARQAEQYGLVAYHRPHGRMDLLKHLLVLEVPVITRTWLKPNEDIGHYRVVTGYNDQTGQLLQSDSLQGPNLWYSYSDFETLWEAFNFEYLVLVPSDKQDAVEVVLGEEVDLRVAWQNALASAERKLNRHPDDLYAAFNRSVALYHLGEYESAVTAFEAIEDRLPSRMLWYQIEPILAYQKLKQYDRVLYMTEQILNTHNQAFSELYQIRGEVYQELGNPAAADEEFRKVRQYNRNFTWPTV